MWVSVDLTLIGKDLIRLLLGPMWGEAGRVFMFFGPGNRAHASFTMPTGLSICPSEGQTRGFRWGLSSSP